MTQLALVQLTSFTPFCELQHAKEAHGTRRPREWLVAFVGFHCPAEILELVICSILDSLSQDKPLRMLQDPWPASCFGLSTIDHIAKRHPKQASDVLQSHFDRFINFKPSEQTVRDNQRLAFFTLLAFTCPAAVRLVLPQALNHLSRFSLVERLLTREANAPSRLPLGTSGICALPSLT